MEAKITDREFENSVCKIINEKDSIMGYPSENCLLPEAQRREIECPVCQDVLEKAKFISACGHKFCESCLDDLQRAGNHTCPGKLTYK